MYYIHDTVKDTWESYEDWWKLLDKFYASYRDSTFGFRPEPFNFDSIAHNENDTFKETNFDHDKGLDVYTYRRPYIIYNEDQIVNLSEIRESAKKFRIIEPKRRRYFRYRPVVFDYRNGPVPYTKCGRYRGSYYRSCIKKNKEYIAKTQEYADLFPSDSRLRQLKFFKSLWADDFHSSKGGKSWKKQKKRKQWM